MLLHFYYCIAVFRSDGCDMVEHADDSFMRKGSDTLRWGHSVYSPYSKCWEVGKNVNKSIKE